MLLLIATKYNQDNYNISNSIRTSENFHVCVAFLLSSLFLRVRGTILPGRGAMSSMSSTMLFPVVLEDRTWGSRGEMEPSCSSIPPLVILHSWLRLPISYNQIKHSFVQILQISKTSKINSIFTFNPYHYQQNNLISLFEFHSKQFNFDKYW